MANQAVPFWKYCINNFICWVISAPTRQYPGIYEPYKNSHYYKLNSLNKIISLKSLDPVGWEKQFRDNRNGIPPFWLTFIAIKSAEVTHDVQRRKQTLSQAWHNSKLGLRWSLKLGARLALTIQADVATKLPSWGTNSLPYRPHSATTITLRKLWNVWIYIKNNLIGMNFRTGVGSKRRERVIWTCVSWLQ